MLSHRGFPSPFEGTNESDEPATIVFFLFSVCFPPEVRRVETRCERRSMGGDRAQSKSHEAAFRPRRATRLLGNFRQVSLLLGKNILSY